MPGSLQQQLPNRSLNGNELKAITLYELRAMMKADPMFVESIAYEVVAFTIEALYTLPFPHEPHHIKSRVMPGKVMKEKVAILLTGAVLADCVAAEFERMAARDFIFGNSGAFKNSQIVITLGVHIGNPFMVGQGDTKGEIQGEAPLKAPLPERTSFVGLQRIVKLTNPNIDRISHDLPIVVQRAVPATPIVHESPLKGEPPASLINPPQVITDEHRYDKTQFQGGPAPEDSDVSATLAARLGIPVQSGI